MSENNMKLKSEKFSRFVSSIKRRDNKKTTPDRTNGDQYYYIHEFEQASEKLCIQYDKRNEEIYQKNLKLYNDINKKLFNTPFNIDNKPEPPKRPSNYDRLHIWKKRNVKISAHNQSIAILYLLANNINIKIDDFCNGVEPFEAVNIAEKLSIDKNENMINSVKSFLHNINLDSDIFNKYKKNNNIYNIEYSFDKLQTNISTSNLTCSNPEHHNVNDKINNFNRKSFYPTIPMGNTFNYPNIPSPSAPPTVSSEPSIYENNTEMVIKPPSYKTNVNESN